MARKIRIISLISYFFIFLMGSMIAMPFGCIILLSFLDFQVFKYSIFAVVGIILIFVYLNAMSSKKAFIFNSISFFLLLYPIINRIILFPRSTFNYPFFYIPFVLFVLGYLTSLFFEFNALRNNTSKSV